MSLEFQKELFKKNSINLFAFGKTRNAHQQKEKFSMTQNFQQNASEKYGNLYATGTQLKKSGAYFGDSQLNSDNYNSRNIKTENYSDYDESQAVTKSAIQRNPSVKNQTISGLRSLSNQTSQKRGFHDLGVVERNDMWLKAREMRRRDVAKMQQLKEVEGCTFKPNFVTSNKSRILGSTFVVSSIRRDNSVSYEKCAKSVIYPENLIKNREVPVFRSLDITATISKAVSTRSARKQRVIPTSIR